MFFTRECRIQNFMFLLKIVGKGNSIFFLIYSFANLCHMKLEHNIKKSIPNILFSKQLYLITIMLYIRVQICRQCSW